MQRKRPTKKAIIFVLLAGVSASALACTRTPDGSGRQSPAPDFNYITDDQLQSTMWQLAAGIRSLQSLLGAPEPIRQSQRPEVIAILDEMIAAADELGPDGVPTNHDRITHNVERFREKLAIARNAVSMNPPRYFLVGNLSGTCLACHASP